MELILEEYKTPFGDLILGAFSSELVLCDWKYRKTRAAIDKRVKEGVYAMSGDTRFSGALLKTNQGDNAAIINKTKIQLDEYFNGTRTKFDVPVRAIATNFQQKVWMALCDIPYGETRSYLELSQELGNIKAIRAVASANGANALSILIPCHRIIGSNGELMGYAGGLNAKKKLLELENPNMISQQLDLF
jgi:methylated-DNA-[protein]-cysteine S-methyltransferase|tara:strand:+ start:2433 stop:3002 length:570 start_codon:yes stop_codon:yes gene_type:complete